MKKEAPADAITPASMKKEAPADAITPGLLLSEP
jgi:hypothetical protein